jgi:hypothetical protein
MPPTTDLEERAIWQLEQAGYAVTIHSGHGCIVTNPKRHAIAIPTSLDGLRGLADQLYEPV